MAAMVAAVQAEQLRWIRSGKVILDTNGYSRLLRNVFEPFDLLRDNRKKFKEEYIHDFLRQARIQFQQIDINLVGTCNINLDHLAENKKENLTACLVIETIITADSENIENAGSKGPVFETSYGNHWTNDGKLLERIWPAELPGHGQENSDTFLFCDLCRTRSSPRSLQDMLSISC